jgi:hypothetical protein
MSLDLRGGDEIRFDQTTVARSTRDAGCLSTRTRQISGFTRGERDRYRAAMLIDLRFAARVLAMWLPVAGACGATAVGYTSSMTTLLQDIPTAAVAAGHALRQSRYAADFSGPSLWQVERFFEDNTGGGKPRGELARDTGKRLFAIGCYVGEVIRRERGGEWKADDADPQGEINVALHLRDGSVIWPVQRVMKRVTQGAEDSIAAYGLALGVAVGPEPPKPGLLDRLRRHFE